MGYGWGHSRVRNGRGADGGRECLTGGAGGVILWAMETQLEGGGTAPMIKNETVKDDGRTLIYYTFAPTSDAPREGGGDGGSEDHV